MALIKISNLTKEYGKHTVLDNVSLSIEENKIYGLLGRNGAGKSTTINILCGQLGKDSGNIIINNQFGVG